VIVSIGQNTAAGEKLTAFLDRMEHLLDEIDGLKDDLKDLKAQVRDEGFNVAAVVRLLAIRRSKRRASQENELLNDLVLYAHATGTPLDFTLADDDLSIGDTVDVSPAGPATAPADGVVSAD
jgi:uncharacterized protein (UPF0335 family)